MTNRKQYIQIRLWIKITKLLFLYSNHKITSLICWIINHCTFHWASRKDYLFIAQSFCKCSLLILPTHFMFRESCVHASWKTLFTFHSKNINASMIFHGLQQIHVSWVNTPLLRCTCNPITMGWSTKRRFSIVNTQIYSTALTSRLEDWE